MGSKFDARIAERGRKLFAVMAEQQVDLLAAARILDGEVVPGTPLQPGLPREDELVVMGVHVLTDYEMPPSELDKYDYGRPRREKKYCAFDDCEKQVGWQTESPYCKKHRNALKPKPPKKVFDPRSRAYDPDYRFVNNAGYVLIHHPDINHVNYGTAVLEHRLVMEQKLGRDLIRGENVHHKNGNRADNRVENLELWSTNQPSGQRVEDKLVWALEILELYGEYVP